MKKYTLFISLLLSFMALEAQERKYIRQGNKEYAEGIYDESEILYRRALEKNEESYPGTFNLGDALYKQEKYEDAARKFSELASSENDPAALARLYHNLGNSMLKANQLEASIEAYKEALRNNPGDDETRHNLAYAQRMLQQQQQNQDQQNQDQENQQQDQENQQQDQENQQENQQEQQNQENQQSQQDQENKSQQEQQQRRRISREDAERMLQALAEDEQKLQEKLKRQQAQAKRVRVLKDW